MSAPAVAVPEITLPCAVGTVLADKYDSDEDWRWMQAERMKPDGGALALYAGLWVAVVNKAVVGAAAPGLAAMSLRERVAERYGLGNRDVVIVGLPDPHVIECG